MKTLEELLLALRDGSISPAELKELEMLLADPAARQQLFDECMATATIAEALKLSAPAPQADKPSQVRATKWWRVLLPAAAAALLLVAVGLAIYHSRTAQSDAVQIVAGSALVDRRLNGPVRDGAVVECPAGSNATIAFPDQSTLELTGGSVAVVHPRRVELQAGKAVIQSRKVPAGAAALRVETPLGSMSVDDAKVALELQPKTENQPGGIHVNKSALILTVAVLAGAVQVNFDGSSKLVTVGQSVAFGADTDQPALPQELKGFSGVVSGTVVSADKGSFVLKIKVASKKNESKPYEKTALADKQVVVITKDVKDMPELAANDVVYTNVSESNGQLVAEKVFKAKPKAPAKTDF